MKGSRAKLVTSLCPEQDLHKATCAITCGSWFWNHDTLFENLRRLKSKIEDYDSLNVDCNDGNPCNSVSCKGNHTVVLWWASFCHCTHHIASQSLLSHHLNFILVLIWDPFRSLLYIAVSIHYTLIACPDPAQVCKLSYVSLSEDRKNFPVSITTSRWLSAMAIKISISIIIQRQP